MEDKGPEHGKTYVRLKDEHRKPSPLKPEVGLSLWDSAESDTESLVQERAYQLELRRRIGGESGDNNMTHTQEQDTDGSCMKEEDEGELHVHDSLEVSALRQDKKNIQQQSRDKEVSRQIHFDDTYAELRYDPNWRTNIEGARQFNDMTPQLAPEEESHNSAEQSEESHSERGQELSGRGGYRYIFAHSPALAESMTPEITSNELHSKHPLTSYHLHPLQNQATREVSPAFSYHHPLNQYQVIEDSLPESTHPSPRVPSEKAMERNPHQKVNASRGVRNPTNATGGEIQASSPDLEDRYRETHDKYNGEFQIYYNQEQYGLASGTAAEKQSQNSTSSKSKGSRHLSSRKPEKPREDIIERNRLTLGINAAKQGSYLRAHAQQKEVKSDSPNQVSDTTEEITIGGNQEEESQGDNSDPELRWLQKTQQLKVTLISKEKQTQQRVNPKPPSEKRLPAQGVKARPRDCYLSSPTDTPRPAARTQAHSQPHHQPQHSPHLQALSDTDSQSSILDTRPHLPQRIPLTQSPTVHLNINLNTSSELLPFMHCNHQDAVLTITSPCSGPSPQRKPQSIDGYRPNANVPLRNTILVNPYSHPSPNPFPQDGLLQLVSPPSPGRGSRCRQGFPGMPPFCQGSREPPHLWHQENAPWQCENHIVLQYDDEDSHRSTCTAQTQHSSGSYTVLPPIGKTTTGDPELGRDRAAQRFTSMQRSSSEGYLAQMRREKQLKERVTYKAYTLKDYKQLKQDVYLGGLGPDYTTTESTAEKMRRQKLYSNVIREQNKKISRIPFLPAARNPVGSNNKDNMVPRRKALEYARSILRPKVAPQAQQPKTREPELAQGALRGNTGLLECLDLSQQATLEAMRKRHEQEKQTVARFKVVNAI